ncbi:DegT/DnrJ/EryC1/StrS family aminotransferase [Qipengyuania aquimaris]|uniref:DegT/DnrJ/EryC1/StrS family aminotransferase n=1 Tax=Qipengyuania aquimaris TaxID=255984 RepID=A0A9Q3S165_9SPHN|nr:DegT/DnrJ/EryC1/StrS family aminotransferase [Qipengyuania aquimaris]MBY6218117.1 DegT/DnrJ/EryC1/StrS family aminotransferase [Qipengyuania aquimaris]
MAFSSAIREAKVRKRPTKAQLLRIAPVPVTRPCTPPLEDLLPYLQDIWASSQLTNNAVNVRRLQEELQEYLGVSHVNLVANGTLGLLLALRALGISGEVITTPYTFVATTNAIVLAGATPVFADIDPETLNLSPEAVEARVTDQTQAILAVHSYGIPCDVEALQTIADRHGIPIIYDAAHCFGVEVGGRSLLDYGTCSILSFHATKVFNTFEGGAVVSSNPQLNQAIGQLANNGIVDEVNVNSVGLNAKMSELHAAIGLAQLPYVSGQIAQRLAIVEAYLEGLSDVQGLSFVQAKPDVIHNGYMFPIILGADYPVERDALYEILTKNGISARRYFYPIVADLPTYKRSSAIDFEEFVVARRAAEGVLCLPLFPGLDASIQDRIIEIVRNPLC